MSNRRSTMARMITHVVVFWLEGKQREKREEFLQGTALLADIPGVLEFRSGIPVPSDRAVVDDSFGVAISMSFADQAAAEAYQTHPIHQEFIERYVKPMVGRLVVYDFAGKA